MPLGPDSVATAADPLTGAVTDATRTLLRVGAELLSTGVYRLAPDGAHDEIERVLGQARQQLREELRRALPVTAGAWLTGARAHLADVHQAGVDVDGRLAEPLQGLNAYARGDAITFNEAVAELPDGDGDIRSAAKQLILDLDQAFTAAAQDFTRTLEEAFTAGGANEADHSAAAASVWVRLLDRGLTVPVATNRRMSIDAYARTITETALTKTAIAGYFNRASATGTDFVVVSISTRKCPLCGPWEGRVLARNRAALTRTQNATDDQVRRVTHTVAEATAGGLFHPYCRHNVTAWVEGFSTLPVPQNDGPQSDSRAQRHRDIERTVTKWDRRAAFALNPVEQARARAKAAQWRNELLEHEQGTRRAEPAPPPRRPRTPEPTHVPPPAEADQPMLAQPQHVLLTEGADPNSRAVAGLLRANAQGAASEFADDPVRNPAGHRLLLTDLQANAGHTGLRFRVENAAGRDMGTILVTVVGPPRFPAVKATLVEAPDGEIHDLGVAFVAAWSGPPELPKRDADRTTGPYLHAWPDDMKDLVVTDWVDNSTGINRSIEVTFSDGSKGLYKPLRGDTSQNSVLGFLDDVATSSSLREVAAAIIDRALGLNLTPATRWWEGPEGPGSLQRWAEPVFPYLAPIKYPDADRQRMAVFDYVLGNYDRHSGNYLTTHDGRPIAIDHGLSLRHANRMEAMFIGMVQRWWPLNTPINTDLWKHFYTVDTGRLAQELTAIGLPSDDIDAALARFEDVRVSGLIPSVDRL